jgi:hypothetical protein
MTLSDLIRRLTTLASTISGDTPVIIDDVDTDGNPLDRELDTVSTDLDKDAVIITLL